MCSLRLGFCWVGIIQDFWLFLLCLWGVGFSFCVICFRVCGLGAFLIWGLGLIVEF